MPSPVKKPWQLTATGMQGLPKTLAFLLCLGLPAIDVAAAANQTAFTLDDAIVNGTIAASAIEGDLLPSEAEVALVDYEPWYQVEIVLFSNINPTHSNEAVTTEQQIYPNNMLAIGPEDDEQLTPLNKDQQAHLIDDELWLDSGQPIFTPELLEYIASSAEDFGSEIFGNDTSSNDALEIENSANETIMVEAISIEDVNIDARGVADIRGDPNQSESQKLQPPSPTDSTFIEMALLPPPLDVELLKQIVANTAPRAFSEIGKQTRNLDSIARSIRRSSRYRLLRHLAWRQPMTDEADAPPILLQFGEQLDGQFEVDGTLQIYRARFLHVITDLWFTRQLGADESLPLIDQANLGAFLDEPTPTTVSMPLRHARRMRSATLHFIDHPQFGILIRIDKYNGPEPTQ